MAVLQLYRLPDGDGHVPFAVLKDEARGYCSIASDGPVMKLAFPPVPASDGDSG